MKDKPSLEVILLGSDHAGYELKEKIKTFLSKNGYSLIDVGCYSKEPVDYPDYAEEVLSYLREDSQQKVAINSTYRGILICASGIGMSIVANKYPGVRAALCYNEEAARLSREHNDSNILIIGSKFVDEEMARRIIETWLTTPFSGEERHIRRINKISEIEAKLSNFKKS